jgi:hypothetical protein
MKTRQELILDFMMHLASNPAFYENITGKFGGFGNAIEVSNQIYSVASALADKYIERQA